MTRKIGEALIGRRKLLQAAAVGSTALAAPALLRAQGTFAMRVAHAEGIGTPITNWLARWVEEMNTRSNGAIKAEHFPAGQLGGFGQLVQLAQQGAIQATVGGPSAWNDFDPALNVSELGFVLSSEEHVDRVYQGELGQQISDICRDGAGLELVAYGEVGFRHLFTRNPVTSLAELRAQKLRVPEMRYWVDFWSALGAEPMPLPYNEQYTALSSGVIDGNETDVHSILSFKWHEQAKHFTQTYHWFLVKAVAVNYGFLSSMPADLQEIVRAAARETMAEQRAENRALTGSANEKAKAAGVTFHGRPDDLDEWVALARPLRQEYEAKSAKSAEIAKKIDALRT